ncbi:hypothetical protein [Micromonospora coerulea]|uniref:hypothetical protein n=1 Tax=Micromonospora coerulea TaxID=47856 RepID=UPI001903911A|nr:hypothetical protein [Micromonospora veneta]
MSTKAVAVKTALKGLLDGMAITTLDNVQVTYGFPTRSPERKWAVVGEVRWDTADWATNRSRTETFAVSVIFSVQTAGGTSAECEAYAIQLAAEFESLVSADPSIGGRCITSTFTPKSLKSWPIDGAYESQFETEVRASARP